MKVLSVVGARPQFIKAAPVSATLREVAQEVLVHTGQHYDELMADAVFRDARLPRPDYDLAVGSDFPGRQTARMLEGLEETVLMEKPDWVLVYGDTNSTLAGALAACKTGVPLAHVEAGLRSGNRSMPEEYNRVLTDHCSSLLFCPTQRAVDALEREGITQDVSLVGDPLYDATLRFSGAASEQSTVLERLGLEPQGYALATLHRPYNVDDPEKLGVYMDALQELDVPVVFPVHPRTRRSLDLLDSSRIESPRLILSPPLSYLDMLQAQRYARLVLTDSGGVQREAFFLGVPCVTLRPETEWPETFEGGWNRLAGPCSKEILSAVGEAVRPRPAPGTPFGDGRAAERIAQILSRR